MGLDLIWRCGNDQCKGCGTCGVSFSARNDNQMRRSALNDLKSFVASHSGPKVEVTNYEYEPFTYEQVMRVSDGCLDDVLAENREEVKSTVDNSEEDRETIEMFSYTRWGLEDMTRMFLWLTKMKDESDEDWETVLDFMENFECAFEEDNRDAYVYHDR